MPSGPGPSSAETVAPAGRTHGLAGRRAAARAMELLQETGLANGPTPGLWVRAGLLD